MPPRKKKSDGKLKYPTGFCANKQCEGTKPKSYTGKPLKTCEFWETCPCKCHAEITEMYRITGMDREPPEQSVEYLAMVREQHDQFVMPSIDDLAPVAGLSSDAGVMDPSAVEGAVAGQGDAVTGGVSGIPTGPTQPRFAPTPTGRRARGQLEYDVLKICQEFIGNVYDWQYCTPKLVAERIGLMNGTEAPSTGAINAVWDRWEKLNFAKQDKKPSRFVGFESDGSATHLDRLKSRAKREKKRTQSEQRRGYRPPKPR